MKTLYIVATPIGNLDDLSPRAYDTLKAVDFIICEDTRVTRKLLAHFGIEKETMSLHHHSDHGRLLEIGGRLENNESAAYVTDAGTPGISDPGGKLIEFVQQLNKGDNADIRVVPIPGPSAVATALSACGFPVDKFIFRGFIPKKKGRQTFFNNLVKSRIANVMFESTHRIEKTLEMLIDHLPDRQIMLGRELTKLHETLYWGTPAEVLAQLKEDSMKGEFTIVLAPS